MFWRGVLGYLPVNVVQGVVGLLNIIVFTRLLTPEQYGVYAIGFSVVALVHTVTFTWLEAAVARFHAPEANAGALPDHFRTVYRTWIGLALALPLIAGAALAFWPMSDALKVAIGAGLLATIFKGLVKLTQEHRRAAGEVGRAAILDMAVTIGAFLAGAGLALAGAGGAAPLAGVGVAAAICLVFALPAELRLAKGGQWQAARTRRYAAYGLPVAASMILVLALSSIDRLLLAAFLDEATVGAYHAGYSLSNRTLDVIFIWLGMAGGPAAIAAFEAGGRPALERVAREQSSLMVLIGLPAAVGLALVAQPLAALFIGEGLAAQAAQVTPWIAISGFFSGFTTYYLITAFTLARNTNLLLAAMAVPAVTNIALNLLLIPRFGLDGAMWATTASYALGAAATYALGKRAIALPLPWMTIVKAGSACALMALIVTRIPAMGGVLELALKAGAGALVFGLAALALDAGGARGQTRRLVGALQARRA